MPWPGEPLLCTMEALGSWEPKTRSPKRNQSDPPTAKACVGPAGALGTLRKAPVRS